MGHLGRLLLILLLLLLLVVDRLVVRSTPSTDHLWNRGRQEELITPEHRGDRRGDDHGRWTIKDEPRMNREFPKSRIRNGPNSLKHH